MGDMLKDEMEVDINCPALAEWDPRPAAALVLFLRARDQRDPQSGNGGESTAVVGF